MSAPFLHGKSGQTPEVFLEKHVQGDWGQVDDEDKRANDQALVDGSRILSAYKTLLGVKIWIITEAVDDEGNRAATHNFAPFRVLNWLFNVESGDL